MPRCRTGYFETYYQDIGKHPKVLLLLHGWGHSWDAWSGLIPILSQHYRLIIPDLPGFGQSESPTKGWSMQQYVLWLETFLQELDIQSLEAVVGHSFGGKLIAFAWFSKLKPAHLPDIKQGAFLVGPSGIVAPKAFPQRVLKLLLGLIPLAVKRQLLGSARTWLYTKVLKETDYLHATPFQETTLQLILEEDIRKVALPDPATIPLHFAWGTKDHAAPFWMAYSFAPIAKNSDVFAVPEAGHYLPTTHTALLGKWLEAWL